MKNKGLLYLLAICLAIFTACKSEIPPGVIPPQAMKSIVFDLMVAEQIDRADTSSATRLHLRDSMTLTIRRVLAIHEVTREDYMKSLDFYEANPDLLKKLLDSTKSYGAVLQDTLRKQMMVGSQPKKVDSLIGLDSAKTVVNDSNRQEKVPTKSAVPVDSQLSTENKAQKRQIDSIR